jgi:hypothetical protein
MKTLIKVSIAIITSLLLGSANAQISQQALQQEAQTFLRSTYTRMQSDSELMKVSKKIWLDDIKKTPLAYYSNVEKISEEDKPAIERLNQLKIIFNEETEQLIRKYNLPVLDLLNLATAATSSLIVDLYIGKITYGEFAVKRRELVNYYDAALLERGRQITAAEKMQRDAAFNGLQNYLLNQNLVNTFNQPARISPFTCNRMGTMVNCW